jgi:hypothetical protein
LFIYHQLSMASGLLAGSFSQEGCRLESGVGRLESAWVWRSVFNELWVGTGKPEPLPIPRPFFQSVMGIVGEISFSDNQERIVSACW